MNSELKVFIEKARSKQLTDDEIKNRLVAEGWPAQEVNRALTGDDGLDVPRPPQSSEVISRDPSNPISVVQSLSTRGFEYMIMFVSLWATTFSIGFMLHTAINNAFYDPPANRYESSYYYDYDTGNDYAFMTTVVLVFLPIFIFMFLRLKRAELNNPSLLKDPSRRKLSHLTQFASFIVGAIYLIYFIYSLMEGSTGSGGAESFGELFLHLLVTLIIAGGVFVYYWVDEHRAS